MSRNLRLAHDILKDQNGGRCRHSGSCDLCDRERLAFYSQYLRESDRKVGRWTWYAAGVVVVALVAAFAGGWLP